jgi:RND family efflux transporter MFP subunit
MYTMGIKSSGVVKTLYLSFFVIVIATLFSCRSSQSNGETDYLKMVKTARAESVPLIQELQFSGILEADEEINLAFRVAGPILKYHVMEGDHVTKGDLIAEMDPRDYEVQRLAVETQVKQLQSEYQRIKELYNRRSVADNDYEKMKAGKEQAEAKLKNVLDQLKDTKLHAPFSGYITKVNYDNGELIDRGMPVASLMTSHRLNVEINVPASLYLQKDKITKIEGTQENLPGETFPLDLYADAKKANSSGLYTLYLSSEGAAATRLAPGMNLSVKVFVNTSDTPLIAVPAQALFEKDGKTYVWVLRDSTVTARQVEVDNLMHQGHSRISSGLQAGEEVVTGGLNLLSEGEKVKVVPPRSESNIGNLL